MRWNNSGFVSFFGPSEPQLVHAALAASSAHLMLADEHLVITYVSPALMRTLVAAESSIRRDLPNFSSRSIVGSSIDVFHVQPQRQRQMLSALHAPHKARIAVGEHHFELNIAPVDASGKRQGFVVEWKDNTLQHQTETQIQTEISAVTQSAASGDFSSRIGVDDKPEFLKPACAAINRMLDQMQTVIAGMRHMSHEHDRGDIDVVIDTSHLEGDFRTMAEGVNHMVSGHIAVKKKAMACIAEFGRGNFDAPLDQFPGKKAFINDTIEKVRRNLKGLIVEMNRMSDEHDRGEIDAVIDTAHFDGDFRAMANGVNTMVAGHIAVKKKAMACIAEFGRGNFDAPLDQFPGKKAFINDTIEKVRVNLKGLIAEMNHMSTEHDRGDIDVIIDGSKFEGDFRTMAEGVNRMVGGHIAVKKKAMACVAEFGRGNFDAPLEAFPGKKAFINDTVEKVRGNLKALMADVDMLCASALRGELETRADATRHDGDFSRIVGGINATLDAVIQPINDVTKLLARLAAGDLTQRIEADYQGTFARMRDDANKTMAQLNVILGQIGGASDTIQHASAEIASGNSDLSTRTQAQAAALEETASSLEELSSTVKQTADSAQQANQLAEGASTVARKGGEVVGEVVRTMNDITEASTKIADIISVIDGIAFQTNILALNAAVEAARAGEQGRGFAVVATEVRSLAQRSAGAAKEIKTLIGSSTERVNRGARLVEQAGKTMEEIVTSVKRVNDIMAEISAATQEQSQGIGQISEAVVSMDQGTQQNAALVEEASAAAASMKEQAEQLARSVRQFKLAEGSAHASSSNARPAAAARASVTGASQARAPARPTVAKAPPIATQRIISPAPAHDVDQNWQQF